MSISNVQPSMWHYGLAVLIIFLGFILFAWSLFSSFSQMDSDLVRFVAPGSADLDLQEAGEYTIFYENQSYLNGRLYSTAEQIPGLQIMVTEKTTGRSPAINPSLSGSSYSMGSRSGRSIMAFDVEQPGIYQINASYSKGTGPDVVLAVGHEFAERLFSRVLMSMAVLFGSILLGGAVAVLTYTRRKKALERQQIEERLIRGAG